MYRKLAVVGLLLGLVIALGPTGMMRAAPGEQVWYFTDTGVSNDPVMDNADIDKVMARGVEGSDVIITLAPGEHAWFYADELTSRQVAFPALYSDQVWDVVYWVKTLNPAETESTLTTRLCYIYSDGIEKRVKGSSNKISYYATIQKNEERLIPADGFTVPKDGRLAIEVIWANSALGSLEIHCNPAGDPVSRATSPGSDPGYPTVEPPPPIPFSMGLVGIASVVLCRQWR